MSLKTILNKYQFHLKIYADFACNLESIESYEDSYSKIYQDRIPCGFAYNLACVDNKFSKPIVVFKGENAVCKFPKAILNEYQYCKKVMKKYMKKRNNFNQVILVGFVKNSLIMVIKKLETVIT